MTLLSPWSALIAAAIAIPLLVLLYFLKLRRQRLTIASTLLWQKSFEDLQVNAPFQRPRWSLLLLLQLLALLAMLLALAEPVIRGEGEISARSILLIDRSASMNTVIRSAEEDESERAYTRLDAAKDSARDFINQLGRAGEPVRMMIIAFGRTANVISGFESDRRTLLEAIDSIAPTDEQADLDAALQLAGAFSAGRDEDRAEQPPAVILLSDGGVSPPEDGSAYSLRGARFEFIQPERPQSEQASQPENVGITAMGIRRDVDDPLRAVLFARLISTAARPIALNISLEIDGQHAALIRTTIPPATAEAPGEGAITHELELSSSVVLNIRHDHQDALAADDTAAIVIPAPAQPRIALVHPSGSAPDQFLHDMLLAAEPQRVDVMTDEAYYALDAQQVDSGARFDMIVFDRVSTSRLPGIPSLTIGGVPAPLRASAAAEPEDERGKPIMTWDRQHPVMRNVALDTIAYAGFQGYELSIGATGLAFGPDGPIIATLHTRGARHVAVGFEFVKSNWPVHVSSAVFLQNVFDYFALGAAGHGGMSFQPGEPITVRSAINVDQIAIDGPVQARVQVEPGAPVTLPAFRRCGLYQLTGALPPHEQIAVSMLTDVESDIRPRASLEVNAEDVAAQQVQSLGRRALWPWLAALAFTLLVLEWLAYCRRVRGV